MLNYQRVSHIKSLYMFTSFGRHDHPAHWRCWEIEGAEGDPISSHTVPDCLAIWELAHNFRNIQPAMLDPWIFWGLIFQYCNLGIIGTDSGSSQSSQLQVSHRFPKVFPWIFPVSRPLPPKKSSRPPAQRLMEEVVASPATRWDLWRTWRSTNDRRGI